MVHVLKVYLMKEDGSGVQEIRRIAVSSDFVDKFDLLFERVISLFPALKDKTITIGWKDAEGDFIQMSSNSELDQALVNVEDGLFKLYVNVKKEKTNNGNENAEKSSGNNDVPHPGVVCDGCNKNISGVRYKCLQCRDYDLCSVCNSANKHPDHDMIKFVKPSRIPREWVFLGARRMWRSMFGHCPRNGSQNGEERHWSPRADPFSKTIENVIDIFKDAGINVEGFMMDTAFSGKQKEEARCDSNSERESSETTPKNKSEEQKCSDSDKRIKTDKEVSAPDVDKESGNDNEMETDDPVDLGNNAINLSSSTVEHATPMQQDKEMTPVSDTNEVEASNCGEGWTLLNKDEAGKSTSVSSDNLAESNKEKACADSTSAPKTVEDKKIDELPKDPKILSALMKMYAMGFTNEGGWLERLLVTKEGNINEALDALYPNTQHN